MHIAIDARELTGRRTGAGRYLEHLLSHWAWVPEAGAHQFTLFAHAPVHEVGALDCRIVVLPGAGGTRWEQSTLPAALRRAAPDVLFAPAYTSPLLAGIPVVLAVHDVSFAAHPEWFTWREGWRRRWITRAAARQARTILTGSTFSRDEIHHYLGVPLDRIRVVPYGVEPIAAPVAGSPDAPREVCVLYVGTVLNRRHVPVLLEAVAGARERLPNLRLVVAGDNRSWPRQDLAAIAARLGIADRVDLRDFVPEDELRRLYAAASIFVFLSEYEGFGFTPLEALGAGVPPIVLDTPVAREVYGDAARFVSSPDADEVSQAIVELVTSADAREALLARAPAVLGRYRWADTATATLEVIVGG